MHGETSRTDPPHLSKESTSETVLDLINWTGTTLQDPASNRSHSHTVNGFPKLFLFGWYLNQDAEKRRCVFRVPLTSTECLTKKLILVGRSSCWQVDSISAVDCLELDPIAKRQGVHEAITIDEAENLVFALPNCFPRMEIDLYFRNALLISSLEGDTEYMFE